MTKRSFSGIRYSSLTAKNLKKMYWIASVTLKRSLPWHDVEWSIADLRIKFPELSVRSDWMFAKQVEMLKSHVVQVCAESPWLYHKSLEDENTKNLNLTRL